MLKYILTMRVRVVVLTLIVLIVSITSPFSINMSPSCHGTFLFNLDVCHASISAVSVNSPMPVIHECPCKTIPLGFAYFYDSFDPTFNSFLIAFQKDRPPRV